jgi:uncharacterized protein YbaP (TraB family)
MIKRKIAVTIPIILFISLLLLVSACAAPETKTPEPAPVAIEPSPTVETQTEEVELPPAEDIEPTKNKSFIWQVSSDASSIYLLGSIHVASFALYPLDSCIEDAFEQTDNLVVEVDINEIDNEYVGMLALEYASYSENETLQNNIPEELYIQLDEYFAQFGVSLVQLNMFRPWFIYLTLDTLQTGELGYHAEYGMDLYFLTKAAEADKSIFELETAEFQIELLSSFTDELMILALEDYVNNPPTEEDVASLFEAWENGDAAEMEQILFEALIEEPTLEPFYDKTFDERNFDMAEQIEEFLADEETYFIVVGAGHLVGENGLVNILDERGYITEQLYDSD